MPEQLPGCWPCANERVSVRDQVHNTEDERDWGGCSLQDCQDRLQLHEGSVGGALLDVGLDLSGRLKLSKLRLNSKLWLLPCQAGWSASEPCASLPYPGVTGTPLRGERSRRLPERRQK